MIPLYTLTCSSCRARLGAIRTDNEELAWTFFLQPAAGQEMGREDGEDDRGGGGVSVRNERTETGASKMNVKHAETAARRKLNRPDDWTGAEYKSIDEGLFIEGYVVPKKKVGKNKGRPNWKKVPKGTQVDYVIVTQAEYEAEIQRYETEEGKCSECFGTGQSWAGWSRTEGTRYRPCRKCNATGKPAALPTATQEPQQ